MTERQASETPMIILVDESTGNKYIRMVAHQGLGEDGDGSWFVKDMHHQPKPRGHPGGGRNALIRKSHGEPVGGAVREALAM